MQTQEITDKSILPVKIKHRGAAVKRVFCGEFFDDPILLRQYYGAFGIERETPREAKEHPDVAAQSAAFAKIMFEKS